MIELNYTNINKAMNISVQSVFHGGERGKKNFTEGNRRLPIFYNNGDTGATSRVLRLLEVGPPEPVRPFEPLLVDLNKGLKIILHAPVIIRGFRVPGTVNGGRSG